MNTAHVFTPGNRLAKILTSSEGRSEQELVDAAQSRVAQLEGAIRAYVDDKLPRLMSFADLREDDLFARCEALGRQALDVAEVAGAGGLQALGEVAHGIAAMVDSLRRHGVWHTDALQLHLNALVLLHPVSGGAPAEVEVMLRRLRNMRIAIGVTE